ncbi:MAG: isoprenylcysteine carboxylmethyltransferase family protein [Desulfobacterales bacterium]|nr:isoprenylcysteine carboxylmethyltransferase family protein [Desulfobacterales bacterium]
MKTAIIILYLLMALSFIFQARRMKTKKVNKIGNFPIDKRVFILGKIAMFITWLFPLTTLFFDLSIMRSPDGVEYVFLLLMGTGVFIFSTSFMNLGPRASKLGIPGEEDATELKTGGLYRFSRNPMYVGFFMMIAGSALFVPNPVNLLLGIIAITVHHFIVLSEERFLEGRFGEKWSVYKESARRYL